MAHNTPSYRKHKQMISPLKLWSCSLWEYNYANTNQVKTVWEKKYLLNYWICQGVAAFKWSPNDTECLYQLVWS